MGGRGRAGAACQSLSGRPCVRPAVWPGDSAGKAPGMTALSRSETAAHPHSSKQMHEKAASLKSSTPSQEKPEASPKERNLETLDESVNQPEISKDEEKKCNREGIPNKYNNQYHKLFKDVPLDETVLKVCSCALQKDILIQGRLYISSNWLCFHANLFGKDIKVVIPVISVQMIKKHKMARLLPNGLAITTNTSRKYIFVSLISRDSVYDTLRRVCTHLQASSKKSLSVKEYPDEPDSESLEALVPEVKWRKVSPTSLSLSLPEGDFPCIHRTSASSLSTKESSFRSQEPLGSESTINTEEELEVETGCIAELRPLDYYLLKLFFVLICLLVVSSSYLAFRIFRLEQQLCSLNRDYLSHEHREFPLATGTVRRGHWIQVNAIPLERNPAPTWQSLRVEEEFMTHGSDLEFYV
uniref:GRAM domain-containing protein n=1 Tax=Ornithorhynchus anatinus TaxID=9258 RepID=A0A6I8NTM8_ORNAN